MITKDTKLTRVDLQGVWEKRVHTVQEWYEYVLSEWLMHNDIDDSEYDKAILESDINNQLEVIRDYAEICEFEFLDESKEKDVLNMDNKQLFIKKTNGLNGGRFFLALDHVAKTFVVGKTNGTAVSYSKIDNVVKLNTEREIKKQRDFYETHGYKKVPEETF